MTEKSYLLVKPDGMIGRGCDDAVSALCEAGLTIEGFKRVTLDQEDVFGLYPERHNSHLDRELVDYMTAGECGVIMVRGANAIETVAQVKGKTWSSGLRLEHADNFLHNTFHCPDTKEDYEREISILE